MSTTESISNDLPAGNYDADELGQYRSLSSLAVVAFLLGLASVLMFAHPLLVVIPLFASGLALLAMRSIATSDGGLTGTTLALAGLGLAVFFGVGSYARVATRDGLLQSQAEQTCQRWLDHASLGQTDEMLELMTSAAAERLKPPEEVSDAGSFFGGMLKGALMRQTPVVADLMKLRGDGKLRYRVQDSQIYATDKPAQARLYYSVTNDEKPEQPCAFGLRRLRAAGGRQVWLVDSWALE